MKALILNSGQGTRMGDKTKHHPKCMTDIGDGQTIISRQLRLLKDAGVSDVLITTGPFEDKLIEHIELLEIGLNVEYVNNPLYQTTNYIYSIYCARELLNDEILLLHGDLVFDEQVLADVLSFGKSNVVIDAGIELPQKDFKAKLKNNKVVKIGIEFFGDDCTACQPLYYFDESDWEKWLGEIIDFCEKDIRKVYAENALNNILEEIILYPNDAKGRLCTEIDTPEDLRHIKSNLQNQRVKGG